MLKLGSSKPWPEAMMEFAGTNKMSVAPLMEYFQPLIDWLQERVPEDERGWSDKCTHVTEGDELKVFLEQYDQDMSDHYYRESVAEWAYNTDITDEHAELKVCKCWTSTRRCVWFNSPWNRNNALFVQ